MIDELLHAESFPRCHAIEKTIIPRWGVKNSEPITCSCSSDADQSVLDVLDKCRGNGHPSTVNHEL